ncbi:helix-turn-helix domain-containing protein [Nonomuraea rhodomycinica]|uniref:Helix-turn-helix transcriptional regulator n=1 Tax=Nonomuraea rhodomycinica TaxID=1712872 RepID=A0A7Y6J041_9ACTN|nr:helix-turn-helix transcriptional regulator [Nonomuraea rhodomycinica]NUW46224.1 helix-turn-helix transcriptional regulator [Nonomuraea rhodomycinica]
MDPRIAELLGIDLDDPQVQRENAAIDRDMRLIETLVGIRRQRGMTQAEVAERMGRSQPAVSDFERLGGDPHLSTIRRYALAIGVDVSHTVSVPGEAGRTSSTPARIQVSGWESQTAQTLGTASIDLRRAAG